DREVLTDKASIGDVLFQRHERDRSTAFFQGQLFVSQSNIDHREDAEWWPIVQLRLHDLFLLRASRFKSSARTCLVFGHPRQQPFPKAMAQINPAFAAPTGIVAQGDE